MNIAHKIFKFALLTPLLYWVYMAFWGDLGAEPVKELNHSTGLVALIYLVANLWIGFFLAILRPRSKYFRFFLLERRFMGILTFVILIGHVFFYFALESFATQAFEQLLTKTYLIFGLSAFLLLLIMTFTSNDYSVRKLGGKKWKRLHRIVYVAGAFVTVHIFLIEKADLILFAIIAAPLWLAQIYRLARAIDRSSNAANPLN